MAAFVMALSFLTITPWISSIRGTEKDMARSLYFYPLVGLILGVALAGTYLLGNYLQLGVAGSAVTVSVWLILTGGLHVDGLMDASDGLFSAKDRSGILDIMRDSRVGAMGAMALAVVLLLKFSFLAELPSAKAVQILVLIPAVARLAMVWAIVRYPYARSTPGLGNCFGEKRGTLPFWVGLVLLIVLSYSLAGSVISLLVLISLFIALIMAAVIAARLQGHTGDTYGFLCEVTEVVAIIIIILGMSVSRVL